MRGPPCALLCPAFLLWFLIPSLLTTQSLMPMPQDSLLSLFSGGTYKADSGPTPWAYSQLCCVPSEPPFL